MSFLYFIPHISRQTLKPEVIQRAGLGDILRDRCDMTCLSGSGRLAVNDVLRGPLAHGGVILKPLSILERPDEVDGFGYYPEKQQWIHVTVADSDGYWIGWDPEKKPTAELLERDDLVRGRLEELGDGDWWTCPIIRLLQGGIGLPDVWGLEGGKIVSRVKPRWNWAWDLSGDVWDFMVADTPIPREQAFTWAAQLLGINYRVGPEECSILGLIGEAEMHLILRAAVNGPLAEKIQAAQKKSSDALITTPANSNPGSEASIPATAPVAASST